MSVTATAGCSMVTCCFKSGMIGDKMIAVPVPVPVAKGQVGGEAKSKTFT